MGRTTATKKRKKKQAASPRRVRGRDKVKRKVCAFDAVGVETIDYKSPEILKQFMSDKGKIRGRRNTGTCRRHQQQLAVAIKRARQLGLLPYVAR